MLEHHLLFGALISCRGIYRANTTNASQRGSGMDLHVALRHLRA